MNTERTEYVSTQRLAEMLCVRPQTIRAGLCYNKGKHYMGLQPIRLPNHRLLWPADAVERIVRATGRDTTCPAKAA